MTFKYSVIVPVYNRPGELRELLQSLVDQVERPFEVIIVEDGSHETAEHVANEFAQELNIAYVFQENAGQGFARNTGYQKASGDYFLVFDSDCILPPNYFRILNQRLNEQRADAFGGPDAAHPDFTLIQQTISHTMTAWITTGGTRGSKRHLGVYHPRSFNMGISRQVFDETKGYIIPFMGEDLEFSTRIIKKGFKTLLIPEALVYHKRRTDLRKFYNQLFYFGRARVNLTRFHPEELKVIHLFPLVFTLGEVFLLILSFAYPLWALVLAIPYFLFFLIIAVEGLFKTKSLGVALLSPLVSGIQLAGYGFGLLYEWIRKVRGVNPNTKYTELYK